MSAVLFAYLLKLTLSLAMVYLFYRLVLQNLTFYNWNRWYLLAFTGLSFLIPLIDISTLWHGAREAPIPAVIEYFPPVAGALPYGQMPQQIQP
ncbi:MAG: peptidase BlaR1 [Adhaeribacter sp.]|nr:peptidase BlaR1 [Adhaeribacter sp.]